MSRGIVLLVLALLLPGCAARSGDTSTVSSVSSPQPPSTAGPSDPQTQGVVARTIDLGGKPEGLVYVDGAIWTLVHVGGSEDEIVKVDPRTSRVVDRIALPRPLRLVYTHDSALFLERDLGRYRSDLWTVNTASGRLVHIGAIDVSVRDLTVDGDSIWFVGDMPTGPGCGGFGVVRLDRRSYEEIDRIPAPPRVGLPYLASAGGHLWVRPFPCETTRAELFELDPVARAFVDGRVYPQFGGEGFSTIRSEGGKVWATIDVPGKGVALVSLDPVTGAVTHQMELVRDPWFYDFDRRSVWTLSGRQLRNVDLASGATIAGPIFLGVHPTGMVVIDGVVWAVTREGLTQIESPV